jgi:hypothetical protein
MAREKWGLLAVPNTATCTADASRYAAHILETGMQWVNSVPALRTVSYLYGVAKMPFVFSHVEYCDMHFVCGFCNGNARAAAEEYQRRFPDRRISSRGVFTRINQTLRGTGCLPSVAVQSEREVVWTINTRENILEMVQRSTRLSTRRMTSRIGV